MYRFLIEGENWILRFSPNVLLEHNERHEIVSILINLGEKLSGFSHGSAFCVFTEKMGLMVIDVERIPSLILTISNIVMKENWFCHNN